MKPETRRRKLGLRMALLSTAGSAVLFKSSPAEAAAPCSNGYYYAGQASNASNYQGITKNISPAPGGSVVPDPANQHLVVWMGAGTPSASAWIQTGIGQGNIGGQVRYQDTTYAEFTGGPGGYYIGWKNSVPVAANNNYKVYNTHMHDSGGRPLWQAWAQPYGGSSDWTQLVEAPLYQESLMITAVAESYSGNSDVNCPSIGTNFSRATFGAYQNGAVDNGSALANSFDGTNYTLWTGSVWLMADSPYTFQRLNDNYAFKAFGG